MLKIATDPLFIRAKKVIDSCETTDQLIIALKYADLCKTKMYRNFSKNKSMISCANFNWLASDLFDELKKTKLKGD